MAIPSEKNGGWDACLNDFVGLTIQAFVRQRLPATATLVDIGSGWGKYKHLLPEYTMDAVEIWQPYVEQCKLAEIYRSVFVEPVQEWVKRGLHYDAAIFGDTLEHLTVADAQQVLAELRRTVGLIIVAVPFLMDQGEYDDNPFEAHQQPDLTPQEMRLRYPFLQQVQRNAHKAVYAGV